MGKVVIENGIMESYEFTMPGNVKLTVEEGVTAFGERCFFEQKRLTKLILPSTLESLGGWCLSGSGIKKLEVPEGTKSITGHAVANCRSLKYVCLPSTLTELSGNCFENCPQLEDVSIAADGLNFDPEEVFQNCPKVKVTLTDRDGKTIIRDIYTGADVGRLPDPADAGEDSFIIKNGVLTEVILPNEPKIKVTLPPGIRSCSSKLLKGEHRVKELFIPEGIEELTGWEFAGTSIREVELPESLKKLEGHVFDGCSELRCVRIPACLKEISGDVFANCPKLEALIFAGNTRCIRENVFTNSQKPWFVCCGDDGSIVYPKGFTVSKDSILREVAPEAVKDGVLKIPYGVRRIAPECLKDRKEITELVLPPGLERLTDYEFSGTSIREIHLPESLIVLHGHVFENCTELETVILPEEIYVLQGPLFHNCPKLRHVFYCGLRITWDKSCFDEGHEPEILFRRPRSERHVWDGKTFSDELFDVEDGVLLRYKGDESLTHVEIPEGVQRIATACFKDRKHITSVTLPNTLRELVGWEFAGTGLTEVYIPDSVRDLDGNCFDGCHELQTVYLPRNMTRFGSSERDCACFQNCEKLERIYYASEKVTYFNSAFEGCPHFLFIQKFWDEPKKPRKAELPPPEEDEKPPQEVQPVEPEPEEPPAEPETLEFALPYENLPELTPEELDERLGLIEPYLTQIKKLRAENEQLQAENQTLLQQKEQAEADAAHRAEVEELRRQIEAAASEKARMETEMQHQRECRELEEKAADLQNRLKIAEVRQYAAEAAMEQMLLAFSEDAPEESFHAMVQQLREAAAKLLTGDDDAFSLLCNELNNGETSDMEDDTDGEV